MKGFTLVEIVLAVSILALVLATLMPNISVSAKMTQKSAKIITAAQLARNLIHEIQLKEKIKEEKDSGKFDDFTGYSYKYAIKKVKMAEVFGEEFFLEKNTGAKDLYVERLFRVEIEVLFFKQSYKTYSLIFAESE